MARVGIFSGAFDPVHQGHIAFCLSALPAAGLDRVVLLPEAEPRGKHCTPIEHRVAMLELAVAAHPELSVMQAESRQFIVAKTLPELRAAFPKDELYLLLGSDVAHGLAHWPALSALLDEMHLVVGLRRADTSEQATALLTDIPGARYIVADSPLPHAASSAIREGTTGPELMPVVATYITQHQLYSA
jgi:nicotinate-nucleotide adenylyltransferase